YPNVIFPFIDVLLFFVRITSFILFTFPLYERRSIIDIRLRMRIYPLITIKFSGGASGRRRCVGCIGREAGRFAVSCNKIDAEGNRGNGHNHPPERKVDYSLYNKEPADGNYNGCRFIFELRVNPDHDTNDNQNHLPAEKCPQEG